MVDLKGIEPSNLTDANRALSQLSYKPISQVPVYYSTFFEKVKKNIASLKKILYNVDRGF